LANEEQDPNESFRHDKKEDFVFNLNLFFWIQ